MYDSGEQKFDAIVIGGGPGGSACAIELAKAGCSVLILERTPFPRFHVGESMLPYMAGLLDQMDLLEKFRSNGYVRKSGAEFTDDNGEFHQVTFDNQGPGRYHWTFQVERSHFDETLLRQACLHGATVRNPASVDSVLYENGRAVGVQYRHAGSDHEARARFVVDASGRAGKVVKSLGLRRGVDAFRMVAVYRHFSGLQEENNPGRPGDIQIGNHDDGWVWAIPVWDDTISVGTVMSKETLRQGDSEELFADHSSRIPRIADRLRGTHASTRIRIETDYCYYSDQLVGPGWLAVGDAGSFVDPIFSGGVFLAMVTGRNAAHTIVEALREERPESDLLSDYEDFYKTGYDTYMRLIFAFYTYGFDFGKYRSQLPESVDDTSVALVLSGDFWSENNPFTRLLREHSEWTTFAPFRKIFGCPVYPELDARQSQAA